MAWNLSGNLQLQRLGGINPPSGQWAMPRTNLATAAAAITSGLVAFFPIEIGPQSLTVQALGCCVGTAQVGGTTTTTLGVYPDNGSGGLPDCSSGPLLSGTVTLTSTGLQTVAVSGTLLPYRRYWTAFLYRATVAPSTLPTIAASGNATTLWITSASFGAATTAYSRYLALTGQTALPTSQPLVSAWTTPINSLGPVVGLQAA